jgi:predicted TIM-barrel fold metal-dependent hydrolase
MRVVDAHGHLGPCTVFELNAEEPEVLSSMDEAGIDAGIIMPYPGAPDACRVHDDIADLAKRHPGRIHGVVNANPRFLGREAYFAEVERCVKDLGFVGVKLHTVGHAVGPLTTVGGWVFEAANLFKVPLQIHTGPGIPFSDPGAVLPRAQQYPDLKIILVHAGQSYLSGGAYAVAKTCPNVWLETSWSYGAEIEWWANDLGAHKLMMGADLPDNRTAAIAQYRALRLSDAQLEKALGGTVTEVYALAV